MKKLSSLIALLVAITFASCSSCSKGDKVVPYVNPLNVPSEFENSLEAADTAAVKELIATYIDHLVNERYYEAAAMVYRFDPESTEKILVELNNDEMEEMVNVYRLFPVIDYHIDYMRFRETALNEVCVTVTMQKGENGAPDATTKLFFNPVSRARQWYLVLDDTHQGASTFLPARYREKAREDYANSPQYNGGK